MNACATEGHTRALRDFVGGGLDLDRSMEIIGARIGGNGWRHWVVGCADPGGRGNCPDFDFPVHGLTGAKVDVGRFIFEVKRKGATVSAA